MRILPAIPVVLLLLAACGGSSTPSPSPASESPTPSPSPSPSPTLTDTFAPPSVEARDLLGIHFDDNESLHRDGYLVALPCPSHLETRQDDPLIPAAPPYLPAGAYLPETAPGLEPLPNPGAIACPETGRYLSAWRYYNFEYPGSGPPPALNIIHWFEERPYFQINSWEWIRVASLAGHDVIEVLNYQVIVPTDDGYMLFESQTGFPYEEVLKVAASYLSGTASPGPS